MNHFSSLALNKVRMAKIALGAGTLLALGTAKMLWDSRPRKMDVEKNLNLERFQGKWYEIARKPAPYERASYKNIAFIYRLTEQLNIRSELHYQTKEGRLAQMISEGQVTNPPENSKFSIHFLPAIRGIKRRRRWVMRIDETYSMVLIGSPNRKQLWLLSRITTPEPSLVEDYIAYAKEQGFVTKDMIYVAHD